MAFHISGIKKGDEVILPSHTMTASPSAVIANKGIPILVDCNQEGMINPDLIEEKITKKTKYIMPVQLNGRTCKMEKIISLAEKYHLTIIEDSAQGLGSTYRGKQAGTFGLAGVFSFYPAKILGTFGDGGMIITNDDTFAEKCFKFRDHGRSNLDCEMWGRNSRLHNLHAAFLDFQRVAKDLTSRGIILAISSKNNVRDGLNVLENIDDIQVVIDLYKNDLLNSRHKILDKTDY